MYSNGFEENNLLFLEVFFWHLPGGNEESHENPHSKKPVS
jgi:hypothetical protein